MEEMEDSQCLANVLNCSLCPICGHSLVWDAEMSHDEELNIDRVKIKACCCGESWRYILSDDSEVFSDEG